LRDELEQACDGFGGVQRLYFNGDVPAASSLEYLMRDASTHFANVETAAEDVAIVAFTSGTTGTPKAAMHYHRDVLSICDTYCDRVLQPRPEDLFCSRRSRPLE
jgi:2-aminobenzoate-CoA ligase